MSRICMTSATALGLLIVCGLFCEVQAAVPSITISKGPAGVGNPPAAGKLVLDVTWANCAGANQLVIEVWAVPNGANPLQASSAGIVGIPTGQIQNQQFGLFTSGTTVEIKTYVTDATNVPILSTKSGNFVVP